jgi:hypothetical protein
MQGTMAVSAESQGFAAASLPPINRHHLQCDAIVSRRRLPRTNARKSIFGLHHQMSESKLQKTINKHGIIACSSRFSHCFGYAHQADCCHSDGKLISVVPMQGHRI